MNASIGAFADRNAYRQHGCNVLMAGADHAMIVVAFNACALGKIPSGYPKVFYGSVQTLLQYHDGPRYVRPSHDACLQCRAVDELKAHRMYCMRDWPRHHAGYKVLSGEKET